MGETNVREAKVQVARNLLEWVNTLPGRPEEVTTSEIERLFTPDATMVLNGQSVCHGIDGMLLHTKDLQAKAKHWNFKLPFERTVVEGDQVVAYYWCEVIGMDGRERRVLDMCIYTLRDGKIAGILENVVYERELNLATFD
jgi:ketosteroid isomerase-like protein